MPETKNNRRVRFTRSALREALIDLILEKPLVSITVKDICASGHQPLDLLPAFQGRDRHPSHDRGRDHRDMREHTPTHKRKLRDLQEIEGFFTDFLEQIRNNPRIMKVIQVLCSEQGDPYFVRKLQTMTYEAFLDGWDMHMMPEMSEQRKLLVFSYTISGMVSMLSTWATRAQDTPTDQVVSLLMGLMWNGLDYFAASDKKSAFPTE